MSITILDLSNTSTLTLTGWANTTNKVITALNVVTANTDIASNTWVTTYGNATNVLTRIKTVDGTGSGLDADLLDGQQGSYYSNASNLSTGTIADARLPTSQAGKTFTTGVSGTTFTASGLSTAPKFTATNTVASANVNATLFSTANAFVGKTTTPIFAPSTVGTVYLRPGGFSNTTNQVSLTTSAFTVGGNAIWHAGNDGASSTLDADLLDGQHGSYYLDLTNVTGTIADARLPTSQAGKTFTTGVSGTTIAASGHVTAPKFTATNTVASANVNATLFSTANAFVGKTTTPVFGSPSASGTVYLRPNGPTSTTNQVALSTSAFTVGGNAIWHAGNDGTGTGLDADLLDGQHGSYYLPASTYTASDVLTKIKTVDGSGSGLDADLLDGQSGTYYASNSYVISLVSSSGYVSNTYVISVFAQNTYVNTISNASNMLVRLKTVDGSGSGLDADLLDGQHGSYYLPASSYTASDVLTKILTVDSVGSGLDADLLDGQHGSYYLPASSYTASDVLSKLLTVDGAASTLDADLLDGQHGSYYLPASSYTASDVLSKLLTVDGTGTTLDADLLDGQHGSYYLPASTYTASDVLTKIKTVDGSGSGLDADLLDGQSSAYYQNADNLNAGTILDARMPTRLGINAKVIVDWNDAIESGWYKGYTATNAPSAGLVGTLGWIYGEVISYSSTYCIQKVWPATVAPTSAEMYTAMRIYHNGSWGSWFKIMVSQEEMDARYAEIAGDTFTGAVGFSGGVNFGSQTGSAVDDLSKHIKLWGTSFGLSVTSAQLNYIGTSHNFYQNSTRYARISSTGIDSDASVTAKAQFLSSNTTWIGSPSASGTLYLRPGGSASTTNQVSLTTSAFTVGGNAIWHAGNDGTGTGLDADLLDGQHGSYYLPASTYTASDVLSKLLTVDGTSSGLDADLVRGITPSATGTSLLSAANTSVAQSTLGLTIGTNVQAYNAGLNSIAGLTTAANKMIYTTASDTYAVADLSAFGRSLIDDANTSVAQTTLGLVIGTNVQAYDAGLNSIAGLTTAADRMIYTTASDTYAVTDLTSFARTILDDADASTARTTLGITAASFSEFNSATSDRYIKNDSVWGDLAVLTDGATIAVNMNNGYDFGEASNAALALGGNRTLGAPSNVRNGKKGILWFTASGSTRTLTLNAAWSLATGLETGPYSITTSQTLGIAYVCRGTTVYVTSIIRIG